MLLGKTGSFLNFTAVHVFNPGLVANGSQVLDQPEARSGRQNVSSRVRLAPVQSCSIALPLDAQNLGN
jgi:hypothetical protein